MLGEIGVAYRSPSVTFLIENPPSSFPQAAADDPVESATTLYPNLWLTVHEAFFRLLVVGIKRLVPVNHGSC